MGKGKKQKKRKQVVIEEEEEEEEEGDEDRDKEKMVKSQSMEAKLNDETDGNSSSRGTTEERSLMRDDVDVPNLVGQSGSEGQDDKKREEEEEFFIVQSEDPEKRKKEKKKSGKKEEVAPPAEPEVDGTEKVKSCSICGESFPSRTKLFDHIKKEGHAQLKSQNSATSSAKSKKKGKK